VILLIIAAGAGQMFAKWRTGIADAARLKHGKERVCGLEAEVV
jgi:hypothetical protein